MQNLIEVKIDSYQGEIFEKIYPGFAIRKILREIRGLINDLTYSSIWNFNKSETFVWRKQKFNVQRFSVLFQNSERLLPKTHILLKEMYASSLTEIDIIDVIKIIISARFELIPHIKRFNSTLQNAYIECAVDYKEWQKRNINTIEGEIINKLVDDVNLNPPAGIKAILLHGSMSDGIVARGYSDFDVHFVIKLVDNTTEMLSLLEWIYYSNNYLLSYNPFMHHGPMIVLEEDLLICTEIVLPSVLIKKGVWLYGSIDSISYVNDDYDNIISFNMFSAFFKTNFQKPSDFINVFDVLWWSSSVLFLYLLHAQLIRRRSFWKRDIVENKVEIPPNFEKLLDNLSRIRVDLSNFLNNKIDLPLRINYQEADPAKILYNYKRNYPLSEDEINKLGITSDLIKDGKNFFEYCRNNALLLNYKNFYDKGYNFDEVIQHWIKDICEIPIEYPISIYDQIRKEFLSRCNDNDKVIAVYEFGEIGCPGLSDLDFLVVLDDDYYGTPKNLMLSEMNPLHAEIMNHDAIYISKSELNSFGAVSPIFQYKQIYGEPLEIKLTESFNEYIQDICYTIQNIVKYPFDLISLSKQEKIRLKTLLAFLNSFNHVKKTLLKSTNNIPQSIDKCIELNSSLRKEFSTNSISIEQVSNAFNLMIEASIDMIEAYKSIWENRFPFLQNITGNNTISDFRDAVYKSLSENNQVLPELPASLNILLNILQKKNLNCPVPLTQNQQLKLEKHFEGFLSIRDKYAKTEISRGRKVSGYIAPGALKNYYLHNLSKSFIKTEFQYKNILTTPLLILITNSPQETFNSFLKLKVLKPSKLYVAGESANAKSAEDIETLVQTLQVFLGIDWNCELHTRLIDNNPEESSFIKKSIDWFFDNEEKGILIKNLKNVANSSLIKLEENLISFTVDDEIMFVCLNDHRIEPTNDYHLLYDSLDDENIKLLGTWKRAWALFDDGLMDYPSFLLKTNFNALSKQNDQLANLKSKLDQIYFMGIDSWISKLFYSSLKNDKYYLPVSPNSNSNFQKQKLTTDLVFIINNDFTFEVNDVIGNLLSGESNQLGGIKFSESIFSKEQLDVLLSNAEFAINENKLDYAEELLCIILLFEANNINALNDLAVVEILKDKYDKAKKILDMIFILDEENSIAKENNKILQGLLINK